MKLKHFRYLKVKEDGNDLNLRMPLLKSALWTLSIIVISNAACKNNTKQADEPQSIVEVNPAFKSLNDSIRQIFRGCITLSAQGHSPNAGKCP